MQAKNYLPLTETSFLILLSLVPSPKHGYAIIKEAEKMSDGRVVMAAGTLYTALRRMLEDRWIERFEGDHINRDGEGRERKPYRLTELGESILSLEARRLKSLADLASLHLAAG